MAAQVDAVTDWTAVDKGETDIAGLRAALLDAQCPIATRNRAAYWIRERGAEPEAREALRAGLQLKGDSVLLRHEIAYVLGQLGHADAVDELCAIVNDVSDDAIVRHEAAEALGAIGDARAMETLVKHCDDDRREVSETCRLSVQLVSWRKADDGTTVLGKNEFKSVDPTPPMKTRDIGILSAVLLGDDGEPEPQLWERYSAMFALRDIGDDEATLVLSAALVLPTARLSSDLLRHEIAFVLGQLAREVSEPALTVALEDRLLHPMVRHEAAEALGAIGSSTAAATLAIFTKDADLVVSQSCVVALDALAYYAGGVEAKQDDDDAEDDKPLWESS